MKLVVPKLPRRAWHADLGLAACLLSARGELPHITLTQRRAILAVAYQVKIARLHGVDPRDRGPRTRWPSDWDRSRGRRTVVRLGDLDVWGPGASVDLTVRGAFDRFAASIPEARVKALVHWAPPVVSLDERTNRLRVHANYLTTALARYRLPTLEVPILARRKPPTRRLTFVQAAALVLHVFGEFIDANDELVCRLCSTATEASLLIGKSINTAALVRQRLRPLVL